MIFIKSYIKSSYEIKLSINKLVSIHVHFVSDHEVYITGFFTIIIPEVYLDSGVSCNVIVEFFLTVIAQFVSVH